MNDAGITGPHATPKGLRHGFGIKAVTSGIPLNMVQKWLGHTALSTTAIYADAVGPEAKRMRNACGDEKFLDKYTNIRIDIKMDQEPKLVRWIGSSRKDVRSFPEAVRVAVGHALHAAQKGETDPAAKPLKGFGGRSVMEIVTGHRGDTWRSVYTVQFRDAVYVLHAFQKKSKKGIATPKQELDLIRRRLADAERDYKGRQN